MNPKDRWKLDLTPDCRVTLSPEPEAMGAWLSSMVTEITRRVAEREQVLLLQHLPTDVLRTLRGQLAAEIDRRLFSGEWRPDGP